MYMKNYALFLSFYHGLFCAESKQAAYIAAVPLRLWKLTFCMWNGAHLQRDPIVFLNRLKWSGIFKKKKLHTLVLEKDM